MPDKDKREGGWGLGQMTEILEASDVRRKQEHLERARRIEAELPSFASGLTNMADDYVLTLYDQTERENIWNGVELNAALEKIRLAARAEILRRMAGDS